MYVIIIIISGGIFMEEKRSLLMLLSIVTTIGLVGFVIYDKIIKDDNDVTNCQFNEVCNCSDISCDNSVVGEQMIFAKIGIVYVSNTGEVYYKPSDLANINGEKVDMRTYAKTLLGVPNEYKVDSDKFMDGFYTFDYKLDLSNVRAVSEFYFGNGGSNSTLLFIHNNGNVSELSYNDGNLSKYKNVSGYSNIESMVVDQSDGGSGAKLYDKCGNGINYTSPRFKNS